ncbi:MAG: glucose 1-dehydrogenase [Anaerolineae bacterium]|nr:glucose 1-dehydrogenase [Anaerolineae bacterium]
MRSLFSLEGKTALVTGAGRGMGQAIAIALAQAGAEVAIASRGEPELMDTAEIIKQQGLPDRRLVVIPIDLSETGSAPKAVQIVIRSLGKLDILVTSSGTIVRKPALEIEEDDWNPVIDLNLKARFFLAQAAARAMQEAQTGGSIIHIASLSSFFGIPNIMAYAAANGGITAMTRAQAVEWAQFGIRVNAIAPGTILTRQTEGLLEDPALLESRLNKIPLNRLGKPEDVAGAAIFLASEAAAYITGHTLVVDGGWLAAGGGLKG